MKQTPDQQKKGRGIPGFGFRLLSWLLPPDKHDVLLGDFIEMYLFKVKTKGVLKARFWFWQQVFASLPSFVRFKAGFTGMMFRSYCTIAFRNLYRQGVYSLLNLSGLAIGIACFVVILLYVQHERSFDSFHNNSSRTYRLLDFRKVDGMGEESASAPIPLAEAMRLDYPGQIESIARLFNFQAPTLALAYTSPSGEVRQFNERNLYFADPDFLKIFDFPLARGNQASALTEPNQIVITQEMASKYFGNDDPIGKVVRFEDKHDFQVSGVFDKIPTNTHFKFDFLVSSSTLDNPEVLRPGLKKSWIWNPCWTYLTLNEATDPKDMEAQFHDFVIKHFPESRQDRVKLYLQPVEDIHLHSKLDYEMGPNSDVSYVYIFSTIAVFILVISCFNFVNLTTARATRRAREIGMRKILGGYRVQLIGQFLSESVVMSMLSLIVSFPIMWALLAIVNNFSGKALALDLVFQPLIILALVALAVVIGVISGIYPAFFLSGYKAAQAVKGGNFIEFSKGQMLRKVLVTGQFALSVLLIVGTTIALKQFGFLQDQGLGFDKERIVLLPTLRSPLMEQYGSFKDELLQHPDILSLTTAEDIPGMRHQTGGYVPEGYTEQQQFPRLIVHDDFNSTLGIDMLAGRDFNQNFKTDSDDAVIINEAMVRHLGWGSPAEAIGKSFSGETVIGVTQDFNFTSLHRSIGPFVLMRVSDDPEDLAFSARYIAVRMNTERLSETINFIQEKWFDFTPNRPFEYLFLEELLNSQYESEATLGRVAAAFAVLSVLIACLGLFGLVSSTTERRIKEIGIRKVLGAPVFKLVYMLSLSFLRLVVLAIVIASPIAYFALNGWLNNFAYQIKLDAWPFISSALVALGIVIVTVSYQTIKAALANPVNSLRYE